MTTNEYVTRLRNSARNHNFARFCELLNDAVMDVDAVTCCEVFEIASEINPDWYECWSKEDTY